VGGGESATNASVVSDATQLLGKHQTKALVQASERSQARLQLLCSGLLSDNLQTSSFDHDTRSHDRPLQGDLALPRWPRTPARTLL
jgi:hypothetical protein